MLRGDPCADPAAGPAGRRRTAAASCSTMSPTPRAEKPPCALQQQRRPAAASAAMPSRLDAVAAHSAAGTLPRAIEVKAIDDCTVDGSTHSISSPAHSGGVSRPGASARAVRPSAGNSRKVLASTTACSRQCRAPASAACGASRAPCRKNISAMAAVVASPASAMPTPCAGSSRGQRHHADDGGDVGVDVQPGEQRLHRIGLRALHGAEYRAAPVIVKHA